MKNWTMAERNTVAANLHLTDKALAKLMNCTKVSVEGFRARQGLLKPSDGSFQKGVIPWNKGKKYCAGGRSVETQFKKGQKPVRPVREMWSIYQQKDGGGIAYLFIKTPEKRNYLYSRFVWERQTGEKLTASDIITYRDGDTLNCSPENLKKISRAENVLRNANREKAGKSLKGVWATVRAFEDYGIKSPYKFKSKKNNGNIVA